MKIIQEPGTNPAAGEHHGCPFKTFDENQLRAQLKQMHVGGGDITYIIDKVRARDQIRSVRARRPMVLPPLACDGGRGGGTTSAVRSAQVKGQR